MFGLCEEGEIWKPVPGFEEYYEVSSLGRIWSHTRTVVDNNSRYSKPRIWTKPAHFLDPEPTALGYKRVGFRGDGREPKGYFIHEVVMLAFVGEKPHRHDVRHKDGVKTNNALSNLEYCTRKVNTIDQYLLRERKNFMQPELIRAIRLLIKLGLSRLEISTRLGLGYATVNRIWHNDAYTEVKNIDYEPAGISKVHASAS